MLPELGRNGTWRRSPDSRGWESSSEWRLEIDWPTPAQIGRGAIVALVLLVAVASPAHGAPYAIGLQSTTVGGIDPGAGLVAARRSGYSDATLLDHVVDGPSVTISIPRELIGSPEAFNFAISATGDGSAEWDRSPDEENACHSIAVPIQQRPDTAMHRPSSNWIPIPLGLLAVLTAVELRRRAWQP